MKRIILLVTFLLSLFIVVSVKAQFEIINTDSVKTMNGIAISPDYKKLYSSWIISNRQNHIGKWDSRIFEYHLVNGTYVLQGRINFSGPYIDYHPILSPDGKRMYFNSLRPITEDTASLKKNNIWYSDYVNGAWTEPRLVPDINTDAYESYPSVTHSGNLYFISDRPGGRGGDVYRASFKNGKYTDLKNIESVNTDLAENDICVDPYERFMLINVFNKATNQITMYVSYQENGTWTKPETVKAFENEDKSVWILNPALTPDGKYFLYEHRSRIKRLPIEMVIDMKRIQQ